MALPDSLKRVIGTEIVVADSLYVPTVVPLGTRTHDIDTKDLVALAARESAKINFGTNMDLDYILAAAIEWEVTPEIVAGDVVSFYMGWSRSATAGTSNPAGLTGADAAYVGLAGGSLEASLKLLDHLGDMSMDNVINTDTVGVQLNTRIATFTPGAQYGILVVMNRSTNSAAFHSDSVETAYSFTPQILQIQD